MATKTITITEDAYNRLANLKKSNESFSDVIQKITAKHTILDLYGLLSESQADAIEKEIAAMRTQTNKRSDSIVRELS